MTYYEHVYAASPWDTRIFWHVVRVSALLRYAYHNLFKAILCSTCYNINQAVRIRYTESI